MFDKLGWNQTKQIIRGKSSIQLQSKCSYDFKDTCQWVTLHSG